MSSKLSFAVGDLGTLIAIEGSNGAGKHTQVVRLCDHLASDGWNVSTMAFPRYDHPSSQDVRDYLAGKKGPSPSIPPKVASKFYADDRAAHGPEIKEWIRQGKVVVLDRYVGSNKGHQAGKLATIEEVDDYLTWLNDLEFNQNKIPTPDTTILLNVPWKIAMERTIIRAKETGVQLDEHEKDPEHVKHAAERYLYVANKEGWEIVECYRGDHRLSPEAVHKKVYEAAQRTLRKR